jgi:hypothetical protein
VELSRVDAIRAQTNAGAHITRFRSLLGTNYLAGMFRTPDDLASQVAAAVSTQSLNRFMVDRVLVKTSLRSEDMGAFGEGHSAIRHHYRWH